MAHAEAAAAHDPLFGLAGRAYVVTGAASGIGRAMAGALLRHGAQVLLIDQHAGALEAVAAGWREAAHRVQHGAADIEDADAMQRLVAGFAQSAGGLDGLFANAGISGGPGFGSAAGRDSAGLAQQSPAHWRRILDVNLHGTLNSLQAALPALSARGGGRIVVTASIASLRAEPFVSYAYAAAKGAVLRLVQQAALDLAPQGITVNAIAPGFIRTGIGEGRLHDPAVAEALAARVPLGRLGEPQDLEGLAVFLASRASAYLTGAVIPVDGGYLLN